MSDFVNERHAYNTGLVLGFFLSIRDLKDFTELDSYLRKEHQMAEKLREFVATFQDFRDKEKNGDSS